MKDNSEAYNENEIIEGNKLIAEFMEVEINNCTSYPEEGRKCFHIDDVEYHSSWDWIMPVIKRFNITEFDEWEDFGELVAALSAASIEDTWRIIVNGIKWYNTKSQS